MKPAKLLLHNIFTPSAMAGFLIPTVQWRNKGDVFRQLRLNRAVRRPYLPGLIGDKLRLEHPKIILSHFTSCIDLLKIVSMQN